MHDGSCIGINYTHRFPKCFKSLHTHCWAFRSFLRVVNSMCRCTTLFNFWPVREFLEEIHTAKAGLLRCCLYTWKGCVLTLPPTKEEGSDHRCPDKLLSRMTSHKKTGTISFHFVSYDAHQMRFCRWSAGRTGKLPRNGMYGANSGETPVWERPPRSPSQMDLTSSIPSSYTPAGKKIRYLFALQSQAPRKKKETQCLNARAENVTEGCGGSENWCNNEHRTWRTNWIELQGIVTVGNKQRVMCWHPKPRFLRATTTRMWTPTHKGIKQKELTRVFCASSKSETKKQPWQFDQHAPIELQGTVTVGNKQRVMRWHSSCIAEPFDT